MSKFISFFRDSSPLKLILISIVIVVISYFIEKPLPNVFMGLRLIAFLLFVYGTIRLLNKK
jgi:pilus assembly protein TadC